MASPNIDVIKSLEVGMILSLILDESRGTLIVTAETQDGVFAGAIASHVFELIACMQVGHGYQSEILSVVDSAVQVEVSHI